MIASISNAAMAPAPRFDAKTAPRSDDPKTAPRSDDAKKQQAADKARAARDTLTGLKRGNAGAGNEAKARAKEKLDALRQQLQRLRMMGATPQQIAQIAKELAEAVKAYFRAGGSTADAGATPAEPPAQAEPAAANVVPENAVPENAASEGGGAENEALSTPPPAAVAGEVRPSGSPEERRVDNPYEKAITANAKGAATDTAKSAANQEDRDFITKARLLARQLRQAAAEAVEKMRLMGGSDTADLKATEDAVEKAVTEAEKSLASVSVTV